MRAIVESVLRDHEGTVSYRHHDRFWQSGNRREAVYGWGTTIEPRTAGEPIEVWFDGLDEDIAVDQVRGRWWRRRLVRHEWRDLTDLDDVLADVGRVLRALLSDYR
ncbi:hypothetical protein ACI799_00110 [Blastococcus sp. SYSU DS0753]